MVKEYGNFEIWLNDRIPLIGIPKGTFEVWIADDQFPDMGGGVIPKKNDYIWQFKILLGGKR